MTDPAAALAQVRELKEARIPTGEGSEEYVRSLAARNDYRTVAENALMPLVEALAKGRIAWEHWNKCEICGPRVPGSAEIVWCKRGTELALDADFAQDKALTDLQEQLQEKAGA